MKTHLSTPLLIYLSTVATTATTITSATSLTPRAPPKCPTMHLPTLSQYMSATTTFCTRHFSPSHSLTPNEALAYTYLLTDLRDCPIRWVLSMTWEQGSFLGGGKTLVDKGRCEAWFKPGEEWLCETDGGDVLVKGGRKNAVGGEKGMRVWVEARGRKDDKFELPRA